MKFEPKNSISDAQKYQPEDEIQKSKSLEQKPTKVEEKNQTLLAEETNKRSEIVSLNTLKPGKETSVQDIKEIPREENGGDSQKDAEEEEPITIHKEDPRGPVEEESEDHPADQGSHLTEAKPTEPSEKRPIKQLLKKELRTNSALTAMEAAIRIQKLARKKNKERVYITSFPVFFDKQEVKTYVFWIPSIQKVCVDTYWDKKKPQELHLELKDLGLHGVQDLKRAQQLDLWLLPFISKQNDRLAFKKTEEVKTSTLK